ncbi:MAG: SMP-30/gluconolactonase/LRE family protein [Flavobacteriales bacterium]|jgi:sugar lactone lactonase YvrE|nr:SMP-30/gluconolactonase/LRE family protein [Flavobacteriales bacterium]
MRTTNLLKAIVASSIFLLFQSCQLTPLSWNPPSLSNSINTSDNDLLKSSQHLSIGKWYGPEDIAIGKDGYIYCGVHINKKNFKNGRILKIDTSGNISTFCNTGSWVTGLHFDDQHNLIACDQKRGLISIDTTGNITILAQKDETEQPFLIPNDVDIATNGTIYFSNTSSNVSFSRKHARKILMEVRPDGGLYAYTPSTKKITTLIDSSFFGNGVAVSQNDEFVLMADLTKYRILRYWLKGEHSGKTDIFIDNLPGFPNGISRRKDGSFWLGFTTKRDPLLDKIHSKTTIKKMIYALPMWLQPKQKPYGMLMHLSENGNILKTYYDTSGKIVSEVSSIEEHKGILYMGGDLLNHINQYNIQE